MLHNEKIRDIKNHIKNMKKYNNGNKSSKFTLSLLNLWKGLFNFDTKDIFVFVFLKMIVGSKILDLKIIYTVYSR